MKLLPATLARYGIKTPAKVPARAAIKDPCAGMNGLERRYAGYLATLQAAGEVAWFRFGALKLRLANSTFYDTDFLVQLADGEVQVHETKGFMRDDAAVKLKVVASQYPFRVLVVRDAKGHWEIQEVKP